MEGKTKEEETKTILIKNCLLSKTNWRTKCSIINLLKDNIKKIFITIIGSRKIKII